MTQASQNQQNRLEQQATYYRVKDILQVDDRHFKIIWTDQQESIFDVVELRRKCPCAVCVDEWTHVRKLKDSEISEAIRPTQIDSVGRYALQIKFDDGHQTGIYTFAYLRGQRHASH